MTCLLCGHRSDERVCPDCVDRFPEPEAWYIGSTRSQAHGSEELGTTAAKETGKLEIPALRLSPEPGR